VQAAQILGVRLDTFAATNEREIDLAITTLHERGIGGLVIQGDPLFALRMRQLVALTVRQAIPAIFQDRVFPESGGLMSYGGSLIEAVRIAGLYTGRVLKGGKPADLPVQQVSKVELCHQSGDRKGDRPHRPAATARPRRRSYRMRVVRMRRRDFILAICGAAALPIAARAQRVESVRRVGIFALPADAVDAFKKGLADLGWIEGRNIRFEERRPDTNEQFPLYAAELARLAPDAIYVESSKYLQAMRHATSDIPIVFALVTDPVAQGFVSSLARPGDNITGFAGEEFGVASKQLDLLKKLAPTVQRVAFMYDPSQPNAGGGWAVIETAAPALALHAAKTPVRTPNDIERAIVAVAREPNGGLFVAAGGVTNQHGALIAKLAVQYRLPSMYPYRYFIESGGLASYGNDPVDLSRRAASYVDRILNGEKPRDMPVQLPVSYQFILNLKTAEAIGLDIPSDVLALTDDVIE
jgi:putative tryptophan/tyrosine transport system substrate-binding protein